MLVGLAFLALAGCQKKNDSETETVAKRTEFFDKSGMDTTVTPGDDFFGYANGGWVKKTKIPDDQTSWGAFNILYEGNQKKTKAILDEAAASNAAKGSTEQKVGDFYASGLDSAAIEKRGYDPIKPQLTQIAALKDYKDALRYMAANRFGLSSPFFGAYVGADDRQSTINRIQFTQSGLSLPEKEYYTRTDEASKKIRTEFVNYAAKLFVLTGVDSTVARKKGEAILALETKLAKAHKAAADLRDPVANYHKMTVGELDRQMPALGWKSYLTTMGLSADTVLVGQPAYYTALNRELPAIPLDVLKDKLTFSLLSAFAPYLSRDFVTARFEFFGKTLNGQPVQQARWKRVANLVDGTLVELLGKLWVEKYFTTEAKERMLKLVNNLQTVYRERINKLDWMAPETKKVALVKLDKFVKKIGYPDTWKKDYSDVTINRDTYFENVKSVVEHEMRENLEKVNKPVDKAEWGMSPPTVNAYANPTNNEIVFPAGILQFPFFDKDADDAINYGGIGMVIGHEMTHLFDDQGRQYDADGNLRDWWTKADADKFTTKAQTVVDQYNGYTVLDNLHLNGRLTLGENLADLGGITLAYEAFQLTDQAKSNQKIDGFTPDQRFFLGYAQVWREKVRPEAERTGVQTDPHSPGKYRVNGPLSNFEPFYKVFDVKPGQKLYKPEDKQAKVW